MTGLYSKYEVKKRSDGTPVENCFVLRPDRDDAAIAAMLAYADVTSDEQLAQELRRWAEFERRVNPRATNADRIRAMSDEELAIYFAGMEDIYNDPGAWLAWLQQPYKEGKA